MILLGLSGLKEVLLEVKLVEFDQGVKDHPKLQEVINASGHL